MTGHLDPDELPSEFVRTVREHRPERPGDLSGPAWLDRLPALVDEGLERWNLVRLTEEPLRWGYAALVVAVQRPQGDPGMLKVGWPHPEADVEHLALRAWKGKGAVRLLAADPASGSLLLERLDAGRDLTTGSVLSTTEALGQVLAQLDRPAPPWADPLSGQLQGLSSSIAAALTDPATGRHFPRRMLQRAASLTRDLLAEDNVDERLVHTDAHQGNVLWRPDPGEWVAIDPKVVAGDPHWGLAPALWNRWGDVRAAHDARAHLRLRLGLLVDAAGLDEDRARAMTHLRMTQNALWAIREPRGDSDRMTTAAVTIIKAIQG